MAELLLELLSEEIPARMQARAADDLKRLVSDGLKAAGLEFKDARAFATPRRLALVVDGLPAARADVSEERRGPRVGAPEQAVQGFLKAHRPRLARPGREARHRQGRVLVRRDRQEGRADRRGAARHHRRRDEGAALAQVDEVGQRHHDLGAPAAVHRGAVRRQGAGGRGGAGRRMAPIRFGDTTRGHRFLSKGAIKVAGFADYAAKLRAAHVVLDPAERKKIVLEGAEKLCAEAQVALRHDDGLLDEVAGLVEWPVPMLGTIDGQFMDVPPEVLIVSMRTHQRYFVTNRKDGALANRFVVVANNVARDGGKTIVAGNERVLRARLADAKFFWDQDRKVAAGGAAAGPEGHRLPRQARHPGRARRAHRDPGRQARALTSPAPIRAQAILAAHLCKADLRERHGRRVPRAARRHGPLLRAGREAAGRHRRRHWRSLCAGRSQRPLPERAGLRRGGTGRQARHARQLLGDRREADRLARSLRAAPRGARHHSHRRRERHPPAAEEVLRCRRPDGLLRRSPEGADAREGRAPRPGRCRVRAGRRGRSRAPAGAGRGGAVVPRHGSGQESAHRLRPRRQYRSRRREEGQDTCREDRGRARCRTDGTNAKRKPLLLPWPTSSVL